MRGRDILRINVAGNLGMVERKADLAFYIGMKRFRLFACLLVAGWLADGVTPALAQRPRLVCDEPVYDFGTVDPSTPVEHTFVIRNEGDVTLEITRVHASCGCTVASISSQSVPPGGESKISSRLSLVGRSGPQQKTILIESNDPDKPQFTLTLKGVAGAAINVQPAQIFLNNLPAGSKPTANVILSSGDGESFSIKAVESTSPQLEAQVTGIEEGKAYRIDLSMREPIEAGLFRATVVVQTDHPKRPTVEVPVILVSQRELVVAPREIVFERPDADPVSRFVLLRHADGTPVEIDRVEPPTPSVKVAVQPFGANGIRIQMYNLVPNADLNGRALRIYPRQGGSIEIPIRVFGTGS